MKHKIFLSLVLIISFLTISPQLFAYSGTVKAKENHPSEEWSFYMDHVIHLLDYVEATSSLREIFDTEIRSSVDLFEKKQRTLDFIAITEEYLNFLQKYQGQLAENKKDAAFQKESEKIQALGEPTIANVRSNLVLATQTKHFIDKMIADKKAWSYEKSHLVFKNNTIQEQYHHLQKELALVDQPILDASMLTQTDSAR